MKLSIVGLLVLGLFAAVSAAILMALLTMKRPNGQFTVEPEVTVLVASRDLAPNTLIDGAAVAEQKIPRAKVPEQSLSSPVQAIGKVTALPVLKGQAFRRDTFVTEGSGPQLAASFPPGMRAVAISISDAAGLDGVLYPGSVVDLILTVRSMSNNDYSRSRTVLESIPVLAIERQTVIAKDAEKQDGGSGKNTNSRRVTLLVDSRQASIVQLALSEGAISLAMRNPQDKNHADKNPVSLPQIMPRKDANTTTWMETLAQAFGKMAAHRAAEVAPLPPAAALVVPNPPEISTNSAAAAAPPAVLLPPVKPKPGWETIIIRGGVIEKIEFPDTPEIQALAKKVSWGQ